MHQRLERVSPLAVPVMLQIGKEPVFGEAQTDILADAAEALIREAMGGEPRFDAAIGRARERPATAPRHTSRARPQRRAEEPRGMAEIRTEIADTAVAVDSSGALFLPASRTLVVADLHLEKASAFARRGTFLPPYDTAATLVLLAALMLKRDPRRVVSLGDSFHDCDGYTRLTEPDRLAAHGAAARARVDLGQRQPRPETPGRHRRRRCRRRSRSTGLTFRHEPLHGERVGEVAGHLHPAAKVRGRGRSVRCRAFATDGTRMVLPAFGVLTGGLNVLDGAFSRLFTGALSRALLIGNGKLFPIAFAALSPD